MSKLERAHWQLLAALKRRGSLSAAAQTLHITQAAASQRLKEAERRLGIELVWRQGKKLHLNPAGIRLADTGERMQQVLQNAENDALWLGQRVSKRWRLVQDEHDSPALVVLFSRICGSELNHDVELVRAPKNSATQLISMADADFALLPQTMNATVTPGAVATTDALTAVTLMTDSLVAVVPRVSPLAAKASLAPTDFANQDYLTYRLEPQSGWEYDRFFRHSDSQPRKLTKIESTTAILSMISSGAGVSILPRLSCRLAAETSSGFATVALAVEPIEFNWNLYLSAMFDPMQQQLIASSLQAALQTVLSRAREQ